VRTEKKNKHVQKKIDVVKICKEEKRRAIDCKLSIRGYSRQKTKTRQKGAVSILIRWDSSEKRATPSIFL